MDAHAAIIWARSQPAVLLAYSANAVSITLSIARTWLPCTTPLCTYKVVTV
jgi:hypothetical protein